MSDEYDNAKNAPDEEWAMSEPVNFDGTILNMKMPAVKPAHAEEWTTNLDTNLPDEKKPERRETMKPVFRSSDGKIFEKSGGKNAPANLLSANVPTTDLPTAQPDITEKPVPPHIAFKPQPYITEDFTVGKTIEQSALKEKGKIPKAIFAVAGIIAMAVFAVAFLIAVYFLFFYNSSN